MAYLSAQKAAAMSPEQRRKYTNRQAMKGLAQIDIIRRWLQNTDEFDLTDQERQIVARMNYAKEQFLQMYSYSDVRTMIMEHFSVSYETASRTIKWMRDIYAGIEELPKSLKRQTAERMATDAYKLAMVNEDASAAAKAVAVYIKAAGLDKAEAEKLDIEKLQNERVFAEVLDPSVRSMLLTFLKNGGVTDLSEVFEEIHQEEYTDYENVEGTNETNKTE
jgi:hypothetical protein